MHVCLCVDEEKFEFQMNGTIVGSEKEAEEFSNFLERMCEIKLGRVGSQHHQL